MKAIENREDISVLVNRFYVKIRKDELLGSIFNGHIPEDKWPEHLSKLTDFWESKLFRIPKFRGNPAQKHINVDKNLNHSVERGHFERWLELWYGTIDELYEGQMADMAKKAASMMAGGQFSAMLNHRPRQ